MSVHFQPKFSVSTGINPKTDGITELAVLFGPRTEWIVDDADPKILEALTEEFDNISISPKIENIDQAKNQIKSTLKKAGLGYTINRKPFEI